MDHVAQLLRQDPLVRLVQPENFVGWVYSIDYESALVLTNDLWKRDAFGVPHNSFLVAVSFNPEEFARVPSEEREVLLLRVVGSAKLPQDDVNVRTRIDFFRGQTSVYDDAGPDPLTQNELQFHGLSCSILGTFYMRDDRLWLGSDLESYAASTTLRVYRPRGDALQAIVNYFDPNKARAAIETAQEMGITTVVPPIPLGTVRYTSTDRLHRHDAAELVPVTIQPFDFLARRTAVLGMTRTGKSNTVKHLVSMVKQVARDGEVNIGQIIYDINGEYANANQQDRGALADIYPTETVRYRMLPAEGFRELQNNFYQQLSEGFATIRWILSENSGYSQDVQVFLNSSFDEPDRQDHSAHNRWEVRVAAYQTMLYVAGFPPPDRFTVRFQANQQVRDAVERVLQTTQPNRQFPNPRSGLMLDDARDWFLAARIANRQSTLQSSSGGNWLDEDAVAILNMLACRSPNDTYIKGYKVLTELRGYHSPRRRQDVAHEVYDLLRNGNIVILDLSVGDPTLRDRISRQIARYIFDRSMEQFNAGQSAPNVVVYVEEAHNLMGRTMDLTETWPRLAKEGAKYHIALVYATQEPSSVHPNILANTENWFITHLNNEREVHEVGRYYDFAQFGRGLISAQDVGFARVKTLSSTFTIPVQIDRFNPEAEVQREREREVMNEYMDVVRNAEVDGGQ